MHDTVTGMTREESLLCARAAELAENARYSIASMPFMTPRERLLVHETLVHGGKGDALFWWGGCLDCERTQAIFLPDWLLPDTPPSVKSGFAGAFDPVRESWFAALLQSDPTLGEQLPLRTLRITGSGFASLTHRDFLGAVLALGVERSVLGDICVTPEETLLFVTSPITPYLLENLSRIGRDTVRCQQIAFPPTTRLPRQYEPVSVTAASPRVDGVVRALTCSSREDAAEMVKRGMVERNYMTVTGVDRHVEAGDILTIRGFGKYRIQSTEEETRRGRRRILCLKYK